MQQDRFHLIAAVFLLLLKDNQVFLSRRANTGWDDGKYCLIGGHLNGNETAAQAAIREAKEETGVVIDPKDLRFFNVCHISTNDERIHFSFVTDKWQGEPKNTEPERATDVGWFPIDNLPQNINDVSKATIDWYKNNVPYSEFGWDRK